MFQQSRHRIPFILWRITAFVLLAATRTPGQEVTLHLRNGDRITGFIVSETTNRVVLTNVWSSGLTVPQETILRREPVKAAPLPATNVVTKPAPVSPPATPPAPPKPGMLLSGEVQVGADLGLSEKNHQVYSGRAKVSLIYHRLRNLFDYSFSYGRTEGVVSANRMDGSAKTDYDLTRRLYTYNLMGAGYDEIRKIDSRFEIGPGLGYHLIKRTNFLFKTEAGVNYQAQYFTDDTQNELFFYRFAEEAAWKINSRLTLDEKFEFFPQVEDFLGRYRFRFESNLRYALLNNLFFTITVLDQYDTAPPAGVGPNDLQVKSTLGMKF
jgi:putative salt-induced outer membrane protein YdiY